VVDGAGSKKTVQSWVARVNDSGGMAAKSRRMLLGNSGRRKAHVTALVSSSADSFSRSLNADGFTTTIDPFAPVSGSAPPAYDYTRKIASFHRTYDRAFAATAAKTALTASLSSSNLTICGSAGHSPVFPRRKNFGP
jgi:hypothetical protein